MIEMICTMHDEMCECVFLTEWLKTCEILTQMKNDLFDRMHENIKIEHDT
jgi:hypothetical protein